MSGLLHLLFGVGLDKRVAFSSLMIFRPPLPILVFRTSFGNLKVLSLKSDFVHGERLKPLSADKIGLQTRAALIFSSFQNFFHSFNLEISPKISFQERAKEQKSTLFQTTLAGRRYLLSLPPIHSPVQFSYFIA